MRSGDLPVTPDKLDSLDSVDGLEPVLRAVQMLDAANSLSAILDRLAELPANTAELADAVTLVLIQNDKVSGWRRADLDCSLDASGVLQDVVVGGRMVAPAGAGGSTAAPGLPVPDSATRRLLAPLVVGGEVVAVLCADKKVSTIGDIGALLAWTRGIEILSRHASKALESHTGARVAQSVAGVEPSVGVELVWSC